MCFGKNRRVKWKGFHEDDSNWNVWFLLEVQGRKVSNDYLTSKPFTSPPTPYPEKSCICSEKWGSRLWFDRVSDSSQRELGSGLLSPTQQVAPQVWEEFAFSVFWAIWRVEVPSAALNGMWNAAAASASPGNLVKMRILRSECWPHRAFINKWGLCSSFYNRGLQPWLYIRLPGKFKNAKQTKQCLCTRDSNLISLRIGQRQGHQYFLTLPK